MHDGRTNFLLILADDLGFSDIGCFGGEIHTPNLDQLARNGLRFADFHAAPACSPTRAMLMTGCDPHVVGIGTMVEVARKGFQSPPGYEGYLNDRALTVAELLQEAGYHTVMSGKWHLGETPESIPAARGFAQSFALLPAAGSHFGLGWDLNRFSTVEVRYQENGRPVTTLPAGFYSSDFFTDKLISYLEDRPRDQPFFAYLPFSAPHWPLQAPPENIRHYAGRYAAGPETLRRERLARMQKMGLCPENVVPHPFVGGTSWEDTSEDERAWSQRIMEVYAGMVERMDWNIGRFLSFLEEKGSLENTMVVFLSDNGAEGAIVEAMPIIGPAIRKNIDRFFDNSLDNLGSPTSCAWYGPRWAQAATAPSRLHKAFTTEGGIRVPAIVSGKSVSRAGDVSHQFATAMDIPATILDLAGVSRPGSDWRGRSVAPMSGRPMTGTLKDPSRPVHPDTTATGWELFGRRAIRRGRYKALLLAPPEGTGAWQLYDLAKDPGETTDLADREPELLSELLVGWDRYVTDAGICLQPSSIFETDARSPGGR